MCLGDFALWSILILRALYHVAILQYRLYAIYDKSRKIRNTMLASFVTILLVGSMMLILVSVKISGTPLARCELLISYDLLSLVICLISTVNPETQPGIRICTATDLPYWIRAQVVPIVAFDFLLFVLALIAYAKHVKEHRAMGSTGRKPLIALLLQDSILFFLM
jgi:hypothetical protein